jgi:hypothetical protein
MRLATWRYKQDPSKERLGFIIDDNERSVAVDGRRDMVDLYGYTSLAVAAIQNQAAARGGHPGELATLAAALIGPRGLRRLVERGEPTRKLVMPFSPPARVASSVRRRKPRWRRCAASVRRPRDDPRVR